MPVIGYLDDLIIVPAGLLLVIRLIPAESMAEHREAVRVVALERKPNWVVAGVIVTIWVTLSLIAVRFVIHRLR